MINDPKFTAYALNELTEEEKNLIVQELKEKGLSPEEIEKEANLIRQTGETIKEEFAKDQAIRLSPAQREELFPKKSIFQKLFSIKSISGLTAVLVIAIVGINISKFGPEMLETQVGKTFSKSNDNLSDFDSSVSSPSIANKPAPTKDLRRKEISLAKKSKFKSSPSIRQRSTGKKGISAPSDKVAYGMRMDDSFSGGGSMAEESEAMPGRVAIGANEMPHKQGEKFNREAYDKIEVNRYTLVQNEPLSTFSVDVDTASYANMRRYLLRGQLPPKDSIRLEELINYFQYDYDLNFKKHPVAIKVDQSNSPWNKKRKLVRVALKADSPSDLVNASKNLVFLLDVSGSMSNPKKLPLLKESMRLLVRKLKPQDTISLVVYAGASGVVLEPTPVSEKLKIFRALDNLSAGGSTNAGSGINAAYKMAKQNFVKGGVNRVILATDGDFNVGTTSQSALVDLVAKKAKDDIFLTVIGLGMGNYQDSMLENLSNKGNGNYAYIDSLAEANKLFNVDLEKNMTTVAKDVKVQIEFNPSKVKAYRLIGYENRMLAAQDFNDDKKDAGEMGAGHTVTALYEIVPAGGEIDVPKVDKLKYSNKVAAKKSDSDEMLTVKVRYKKPTETKSTKFDVVLKDGKNDFNSMDSDFKFATSVASFGMILRNDPLVGDLTFKNVENLAKKNKGQDPYDFREEFIELVDLARQIDSPRR